MRADSWIVEYLISQGVTDAFGIPGAVILDFLYALDDKKDIIKSHLCFHEQAAAFAACGYAQTSGKLGVAYATRGPGFTNMITAIADAYYDSVPTLFITAHAMKNFESSMRVLNNQEIDTVSLVKNITKRAVRIDTVTELQREVVLACYYAMNGRKGPVFLDIYSGLFSQEVSEEYVLSIDKTENTNLESILEDIEISIKKAKRPLFLIGNGIRNGGEEPLCELSKKWGIPILSSRSAQDVASGMPNYYGYIGSRATRYSNFILSKTDLIIAVGNRMAFPVESKSFKPVVENTKTIRVDIDASEFTRIIPNSRNYCADARIVLKELLSRDLSYNNNKCWLGDCNYIKQQLNAWDDDLITQGVSKIIKTLGTDASIVSDVGNHSFWVTQAYAIGEFRNRIMYSGSFGTLGSALPKAIGSYYATCNTVGCFVGDQGVQFNIQELQFIASNKLPIVIVILNNSSSGMIMERELDKYDKRLVHTTINDGYSFPSFESIANSYGLAYLRVDVSEFDISKLDIDKNKPYIIEIMIDSNTRLKPYLPNGRMCQDLSPDLPRELFTKLEMI